VKDPRDRDLEAALRREMPPLAPAPSESLLDRVHAAVDAVSQVPADDRWTGWRSWVASVAAASVVAAGVAAGLLVGDSVPPPLGQSPSVSTALSPPATSVSAARSPSAVPATPTALPGTFERFDLPDPAPGVFSGTHASDVVAFQGGFVAIGSFDASCVSDIHEPPPDCETALLALPTRQAGVVWVSDDARVWTMLPTEGAFEGATLRHMATDGERIVVTGAVTTVADGQPSFLGERQPRVWVSEDGRTWTVTADAGVLPEHIVSTAAGFVGARNTDDGPQMMVSVDGREWRAVTDPGALGRGDIMSMSVGRDGETVVAAGAAFVSDDSESVRFTATSWLTRDGESWERSQADGGGEGSWMSSAAQFDSGWVAVGQDQTPTSETAIWTSADGLDWSRVDSAAVPVTPYGSADAVVWTGDELIATGTVAGETGSVIAFWRSRDGTAWDVVGDPPDLSAGTPYRLLALDGWAIGAGVRSSGPDHWVGVIWIASP
jgi:hypothetical protein